jgi:FlaG/FlaF family flagellin (archaellin)
MLFLLLAVVKLLLLPCIAVATTTAIAVRLAGGLMTVLIGFVDNVFKESQLTDFTF